MHLQGANDFFCEGITRIKLARGEATVRHGGALHLMVTHTWRVAVTHGGVAHGGAWRMSAQGVVLAVSGAWRRVAVTHGGVAHGGAWRRMAHGGARRRMAVGGAWRHVAVTHGGVAHGGAWRHAAQGDAWR